MFLISSECLWPPPLQLCSMLHLCKSSIQWFHKDCKIHNRTVTLKLLLLTPVPCVLTAEVHKRKRVFFGTRVIWNFCGKLFTEWFVMICVNCVIVITFTECKALGMTGQCCPTPEGIILACCNSQQPSGPVGSIGDEWKSLLYSDLAGKVTCKDAKSFFFFVCVEVCEQQ